MFSSCQIKDQDSEFIILEEKEAKIKKDSVIIDEDEQNFGNFFFTHNNNQALNGVVDFMTKKLVLFDDFGKIKFLFSHEDFYEVSNELHSFEVSGDSLILFFLKDRKILLIDLLSGELLESIYLKFPLSLDNVNPLVNASFDKKENIFFIPEQQRNSLLESGKVTGYNISGANLFHVFDIKGAYLYPLGSAPNYFDENFRLISKNLIFPIVSNGIINFMLPTENAIYHANSQTNTINKQAFFINNFEFNLGQLIKEGVGDNFLGFAIDPSSLGKLFFTLHAQHVTERKSNIFLTQIDLNSKTFKQIQLPMGQYYLFPNAYDGKARILKANFNIDEKYLYQYSFE